MRDGLHSLLLGVSAGAVLVALILGPVWLFASDEPDFTACHANRTCDEGRCHQLDGRALCVRSSKLVDARRPACFSVAGDDACFATQAECLRWRARAVDHGLAATECADGTPRPADSVPANAAARAASLPLREGAP